MGKAGATIEEATAKEDLRLERELQSQISQFLSLRSITFINPPFGKKSQLPVGFPDFSFVWSGMPGQHVRPICIEAKGPVTKVTKEQYAMHERLRSEGWEVYIVRSVAEVKSILDNLPPDQ